LIVDFDFDYLIADRSYAAQTVRDALSAKGTKPVIPSPKNANIPRSMMLGGIANDI
jgi:hypothetical protein